MPTEAKPAPKSNFDLTDEEKQTLIDETKAIRAAKKKREDINAQINASRKKIKSLGIDLDAWRASERRWEMDPDERDEFDRSHAIVNQALGIPSFAYQNQADMFEEDEATVAARNAAVKASDGGDLPDSATDTVQ